ncbi:MAG: ATP synthase subunit C [Erysipelotrichaceae bacterium]|nr:ATP synthase subunit C [Erysipelotrichaceae bacterium]
MLSMFEVLAPLFAVALVIGPLWYFVSKGVNAKNCKSRLLAQISIFSGVFLIAFILQFNGLTTFAQEAETTISIVGTNAQGIGFFAAALSTGLSALGAGIAVAAAAPAAIGAISENSDNFGKAIIFVALGEGVAIYGLLISILIINNL